MSIREEFKLKPIPKANYYGRHFSSEQKTKKRKKEEAVKRNGYLERVKAREEKARAFDERKQDVLLWTLREVQGYFNRYDVKMSVRMNNIIDNIVVKKYEDQ